jgi:hypothetical protein
LAKSLNNLDPEIADLISRLPRPEQYSDSKVQEDIEELIELRDQAEEEYVSLLYTYRRQRLIALGTVAMGLIGVILVVLLRSLHLLAYQQATILLILSSALTVASGFAVYVYRFADPRPRFAIERQRRTLTRLEERLDEYSVKESTEIRG